VITGVPIIDVDRDLETDCLLRRKVEAPHGSFIIIKLLVSAGRAFEKFLPTRSSRLNIVVKLSSTRRPSHMAAGVEGYKYDPLTNRKFGAVCDEYWPDELVGIVI